MRPRPFNAHSPGAGGRGLDAMGRAARRWHHRRCNRPMERPMPQPNDLSRSLVALEQDSTLIAVIEMGQASWLVAGIVPGVNRHPLKKIATDQEQLLQVLRRCPDPRLKGSDSGQSGSEAVDSSFVLGGW